MRKFSRKAEKKGFPKFPPAVLFFCILAIGGLLVRGCFSLEQSALKADDLAGNKLNPAGELAGHRNIFDRGYRELAVSFKMKSLYASPLEIENIDQTATLLGNYLDLDKNKLARELKSERSFVWLGRRLPESRADEILKKELPGIYAVAEAQRFYPAHRSGAHVVGFLEENSGLAGVEFSYDHVLRRGAGAEAVAGDGAGGHLQLTLDLRIQKLLASGLDKLLVETGASSGTTLLMDGKTGAILAMANLPDYDPNSYWDSSTAGRQNRAITASVDGRGFAYLFGLAAAYEEVWADSQGQLASLKKELRLDQLPKGSRVPEWFARYGDNLLSPEFGSGTEELAGDESAAFVERLGLFRKSGIDLPETNDSPLSHAGQTTPINLLAAFAPLVNGGIGVTPHLGAAIIEPQSGRRRTINHPVKPGLVKPQTSEKIIELLTNSSRSPSEALFLESMRTAASEAKDGADEQQSATNRPARYQTVMIGFTPPQKAGLILLISLDQAIVDSRNKTPMRRMGEAMMARMVRLAGEKVVPPGLEALAASEKLIYENWLKSQAQVVKKNNLHAVAGHEKREVMPDLRGLSLRKALRNLQELGLKVKIVGSGKVVAQKPECGLAITGNQCLLTLKADS